MNPLFNQGLETPENEFRKDVKQSFTIGRMYSDVIQNEEESDSENDIQMAESYCSRGSELASQREEEEPFHHQINDEYIYIEIGTYIQYMNTMKGFCYLFNRSELFFECVSSKTDKFEKDVPLTKCFVELAINESIFLKHKIKENCVVMKDLLKKKFPVDVKRKIWENLQKQVFELYKEIGEFEKKLYNHASKLAGKIY